MSKCKENAKNLIVGFIVIIVIIFFIGRCNKDNGIYTYNENAVLIAGECFVLNDNMSNEGTRAALEQLLKLREVAKAELGYNPTSEEGD